MLSSPAPNLVIALNSRIYASRADRFRQVEYDFVQSPESWLTNGALPRPIVPIFGISKKQHSETTSFGCNASSANEHGGRGAACVEDLESPHE